MRICPSVGPSVHSAYSSMFTQMLQQASWSLPLSSVLQVGPSRVASEAWPPGTATHWLEVTWVPFFSKGIGAQCHPQFNCDKYVNPRDPSPLGRQKIFTPQKFPRAASQVARGSRAENLPDFLNCSFPAPAFCTEGTDSVLPLMWGTLARRGVWHTLTLRAGLPRGCGWFERYPGRW